MRCPSTLLTQELRERHAGRWIQRLLLQVDVSTPFASTVLPWHATEGLARFSKGAERMLGTAAEVQNARRTNETKVFMVHDISQLSFWPLSIGVRPPLYPGPLAGVRQ
jgi:hypothetical protein